MWLSWDDPATLTADPVILRATWDYIERPTSSLAGRGRSVIC